MKIEELASSQDYKSLGVIDKLSSTRILAKELKTQTNLFTIATASTNLAKDLKSSTLENKDEIISNLQKIANTVNGLIESSNLDKDTARKHIKKLKKRAGKITAQVGSNLKTLLDNKVYAISFEDLEKLKANLDEDHQEEIDKILDQNASAIKNLQKHASNLPTSKDASKSFILASVPIVAISPLSQKDFTAGGFSVSPLGMYSVLDTQLVIGINPDKLDGIAIDKYLGMIVKGLENQSGMRYIVMSHPKPYKSSGLIYYWIVEEKLVNRLRSQSGKTFLVNKWGFAFK